MNNELLLQHRVHFLSTHRGERKSENGIEYIISDDERYNLAFPSSIDSIKNISKDFKICLPEWVAVELPDKERKLHRSISFMTLKSFSTNNDADENISVKRAETLLDIEDFTLAQTKGFYGDLNPDAFNAKLLWLKEKNIKNFPNKNHGFLTAYYDNKLAGGGLSILYENIVGINMLATLPEFREHGISTAIIKSVVEYAIEKEIPTVTLQVDTDSYAHKFYKKRGFVDEFMCREYI